MNCSGIKKNASGMVLATFGAMVLGIGTASASVITWNVHTESQFDTASTVISSGSGSSTVSDYALKWGEPSNISNPDRLQSQLVIDPHVANTRVNTYTGSGSVPASYQGDTGVILTHFNYVQQTGSTSLVSTALLNTITLTPVNPAGPALAPISLDFGINFRETPNSGTCSASGITDCPDIFVVDNAGLNMSFEYDGLDYFLSVFALGPTGEFNILSDAACIEAGANPGCQGFTTEEDQSNPMHFGVTITTRAAAFSVPAPGSLALLGLALLGMAGVVRRRQSMRD